MKVRSSLVLKSPSTAAGRSENGSLRPSQVRGEHTDLVPCRRRSHAAAFLRDLLHLMSKITKTNVPALYDQVMNRLMEGAERLFAQNGVAGTSLQEPDEAFGLT
jgi:hypothetical protein